LHKKLLPVALFNGTVATTTGLYKISDIDLAQAKKMVAERGFVSAIGHEATAEIMSDLFGENIPMNRIQFHQEIGQPAIAFKLNERPPEGEILIREELEEVGFSLKLMERLE